jgi:AAA domain
MTNIDDLAADQRTTGPRFGVRPADPSKMRPIEFVYEPWIVRGRGNEIVGEEDVGKSTFAVYIAAKLTTGDLPGVFEGQPKDVLFLGTDEDDWDGMTLPRLHAAGADLARVYELYTLDANAVFNAQDHGSELGRLLAHDFGLIVIEHVLDILPRMHNPNEPTAIRRALRPMLRVMAARETGALWTRHVNKAEARSFRQKAQGSAQFGAVARSSFLIAQHPKDAMARVAILGKANYVKDKVALTFSITDHTFTANEYDFNVGRVVNVEKDSTTMDEALAGGPSDRERKRDALRAAVLGVVSGQTLGNDHLTTPLTRSAIARKLGRDKSDQSVRRVLEGLEEDGLVKQVDGGWIRAEQPPTDSNGHGTYAPEDWVVLHTNDTNDTTNEEEDE